MPGIPQPSTPVIPGIALQTVFNLTDRRYGGKGDGVTDNTTAINKVLAAIPATGGTIYIPTGTYRINGQLQFPHSGVDMPPVTVVGDGCGANFNRAATTLDLRYDGHTSWQDANGVSHYNQFVGDYAVVSGLNVVWTAGQATLSITAGLAYIGNANSTTPPRSLGTYNNASVALLGNGTYYLDYDGTTPTFSPTIGSWTTGAIRLAQVSVSGGVITNVVDWTGRLAKIDARYFGRLMLRDLELACLDATRGLDEVPLFRVTCTVPVLDHVSFRGAVAAGINTPAQLDAIVFGGPGGPTGYAGGAWAAETTTAYSPFGGYGGSVNNVLMNNIRRCVYWRNQANGLFVRNVTAWAACGGPGIALLDTCGLTVISGTIDSVLAEMTYTSYLVGITQGNPNFNIENLQVYDPSLGVLSTTASQGATSVTTSWSGSPLVLSGLKAVLDPNGATPEIVTVATTPITGAVPSGTPTLAATASPGNSIQVTNASGLSVGMGLLIDGSTQEYATITAINGTVLTVSPSLAATHTSGVSIYATPWVIPLTAATAHSHGTTAFLSTTIAVLHVGLAGVTPRRASFGTVGSGLLTFLVDGQTPVNSNATAMVVSGQILTPSGVNITNQDGTLNLPIATTSKVGGIKGDGATTSLAGDGTLSIPGFSFSNVGVSRQTVYNARDFGARGDLKTVTDAVVTASSATISSASANFVNASIANGGDIGKLVWLIGAVSADPQRNTTNTGALSSGTAALTASLSFTSTDRGKLIQVNGAGAAGANLLTHIAWVVDATHVILATNASTTVTTANVTLYGYRSTADGAFAAANQTLTSASANFTNADYGAWVTVAGAGASGGTLTAQIIAITNSTTVTVYPGASTAPVSGAALNIYPGDALAGTITAVGSANSATLSVPAGLPATGLTMRWGSPNGAAFQSAFNALSSGGRLFVPPGNYAMDVTGYVNVYAGSINPFAAQLTQSNVAIEGQGATLVMAGGETRSSTMIFVGDQVNGYNDIAFTGLTFDGNAPATRNPSLVGDIYHCIPPQASGAPNPNGAPIWGSDDFNGGVVIEGEYTPSTSYPRAGQKYTRRVHFTRCNWQQWSNAGLLAVQYAEELRLLDCDFDGSQGGIGGTQPFWATMAHLAGITSSKVEGCWFRNSIPLRSSLNALLLECNGDAGPRPSSNNVVRANRFSNIWGGSSAIGGVLQHCHVEHNNFSGCHSTPINIGFYSSATTGIYQASLETIIAHNTMIDCNQGITVDGAPGTTHTASDGSISNGSSIFNSASATWTGGSPTVAIGDWIQINGAGPGGTPLMAIVSGINTGQQLSIAPYSNTSGVTVSGATYVTGGQAGANSNFNQIHHNIITNNSATTKNALRYTTNLLTYTAVSWTAGGLAITVAANGVAAPMGGNRFFCNHIEGYAGSNVLQDNTIGCPAPNQNTSNATVWNRHELYDIQTEQLIASHYNIASANIIFSALTKDGVITGQVGGGASNFFGTALLFQRAIASSWTPSIGSGTVGSTTVTVNGALPGDIVAVSHSGIIVSGITLTGQVTSANTVTVTARNDSGSTWAPTGNLVVEVKRYPSPAAS